MAEDRVGILLKGNRVIKRATIWDGNSSNLDFEKNLKRLWYSLRISGDSIVSIVDKYSGRE